jgi:hypothetical protein
MRKNVENLVENVEDFGVTFPHGGKGGKVKCEKLAVADIFDNILNRFFIP